MIKYSYTKRNQNNTIHLAAWESMDRRIMLKTKIKRHRSRQNNIVNKILCEHGRRNKVKIFVHIREAPMQVGRQVGRWVYRDDGGASFDYTEEMKIEH